MLRRLLELDRSWRRNPADPALRVELRRLRKQYQRAVRVGRATWRDQQAPRLMEKLAQDEHLLWRQLGSTDRVSPAKSPEDVRDFFRTLFNPTVAPVDPETLRRDPPVPPPAPLSTLDDPFSETELREGLEALKSGRAGDEWGLTAEALKPLANDPAVLLPLLNRILEDGFPDPEAELDTAILVPIYKGKGTPDDLNNFRGIAVLPALTKLYATLLNRRLARALSTAGLRAATQFGFRAKRGTAEAAFVLRTALDSREGQPTAMLFVDFKKAFDSVQRPVLWQLMRNLGIPERFVRAVESYYASVRFRVELPGGLSEPFHADVGVKQGCPLSPTLFGIFVESLLHDFKLWADDQAEDPRLQLGGQPLDPLTFADDIVLVAVTTLLLQKQTDQLAKLASRYGLQINVAKTKALLYTGSQRRGDPLPPQPPAITVDGAVVEWVKEFRYLGLLLHQERGFLRAAEVLCGAGIERYGRLLAEVDRVGLQDAVSLSRLFDSLVNSIIGYGACVWGPQLYSQPASNTLRRGIQGSNTAIRIERLQRRFQRFVLGLSNPDTPSMILALETNRAPIETQFFGTTLGFLHRVAKEPPTSVLRRALTASVVLYRDGKASWASELDAWATRVHALIDWTAVAPDVPALHQPLRQQPPRAARADQQPEQRRAFWQSREGRERARQCYATAIVDEAERDPASTLARVVTHHLDEDPEHLGLKTTWDRRPHAFYARVATTAGRGLLARARLGLPIRGFSVWTGGGRYDDGLPPNLARRPLKPHPTPCLGCLDPTLPRAGRAPPRYRDRTLSLEHACICSSRAFVTLRRETLPELPSAFQLAELLTDPPRGLLLFLQQAIAFFVQLRAGNRRALLSFDTYLGD